MKNIMLLLSVALLSGCAQKATSTTQKSASDISLQKTCHVSFKEAYEKANLVIEAEVRSFIYLNQINHSGVYWPVKTFKNTNNVSLQEYYMFPSTDKSNNTSVPFVHKGDRKIFFLTVDKGAFGFSTCLMFLDSNTQDYNQFIQSYSH